jgi:hypothetical protein
MVQVANSFMDDERQVSYYEGTLRVSFAADGALLEQGLDRLYAGPQQLAAQAGARNP